MTKAKLYDDFIMDHIKNARNYRVIENAAHRADGSNPLCGDEMTVFLRIEGRRILDVAYQCTCCGISMASASIMTEQVLGGNMEEVRALVQAFRAMPDHSADLMPRRLVPAIQLMLETVRQYPLRVRCAVLPWTILGTILDDVPGGE